MAERSPHVPSAVYKATTAVGAHILQNPFRAVCAEGALITTDTRLKRGRRQRLITVLTGRSEFEHGASPDSRLTFALRRAERGNPGMRSDDVATPGAPAQAAGGLSLVLQAQGCARRICAVSNP